MKATGIVRRIDDLRNVIIPKEICKILKIREGDQLELYIDGSMICFQKYDSITRYRETLEELISDIHQDYDYDISIAAKQKLEEVMKLIETEECGDI